MTVTYNLKSAGADSAGREQSYVLPALPMRILSLVPRAAGDIRDASSLTFAEIESRRYYATAARVAAAIALVFAAVFAVLAVAALRAALPGADAGHRRVRCRRRRCWPAAPRRCAACRTTRAPTGWSPALARARAAGHARCRRLGARPPDRAAVTSRATSRAREGQVVVRTGRLRIGRAVVSAATTPSAIASALDRPVLRRPRPRRADAARRARCRRSAAPPTAVRASEPVDGAALDRALEDAIDAVGRLRVGALWPMRMVQTVARSVMGA